MFTVNPVRLAIILVVLSRPRPMRNLLAYWVATAIAGFFYLLTPLVVLHYTGASSSFAKDVTDSTASPVGQRIAIGLGALLLVVAVLMAVRFVAAATPSRAGRHTTQAGSGSASTSTRTIDPATLPIISRLRSRASDGTSDGTSWGRRLLNRAREAWQNGSPWIAFVVGLVVMPADGVLWALALIVTSGDALGTQLAAAIVFVFAALAIEEVILVSNVLAPEKTEAALRRFHNFAVAHHQKFTAGILALVGISLIVQGFGGF
jgi:hypothetical protein